MVCRKPFTPRQHKNANNTYCSTKCRSKYWNERNGIKRPYPHLNTGTVGAIGELRVCVDLLEKGFEAFRAVSYTCSCDVAVLKDGKLLRIEVRTGYRYKTGQIHFTKNETKNRCDHYAVVLPEEIIYVPPLPNIERSLAQCERIVSAKGMVVEELGPK